MLLDPASGAVTPFLETAASESFKGVNDLVFAASGTLYFTDQGQTGMHDPTGRVWKLTPDGRLTCLVNTVPSPNGIVVDPEESFLLAAVTRANQIWRVPLPASGLVTKVGIFAHLHGGSGGPDGLAFDAEGNLLVCHTGFGSVWRLSPGAEPLDRIVSCAGVGTKAIGRASPCMLPSRPTDFLRMSQMASTSASSRATVKPRRPRLWPASVSAAGAAADRGQARLVAQGCVHQLAGDGLRLRQFLRHRRALAGGRRIRHVRSGRIGPKREKTDDGNGDARPRPDREGDDAQGDLAHRPVLDDLLLLRAA